MMPGLRSSAWCLFNAEWEVGRCHPPCRLVHSILHALELTITSTCASTGVSLCHVAWDGVPGSSREIMEMSSVLGQCLNIQEGAQVSVRRATHVSLTIFSILSEGVVTYPV